MFNYTKVQTDAVKKLVKGEKVRYDEGEYDIYITLDGFALYIIPKFYFYLDTSKMTSNNNFKSIVDNFCNAEMVEYTQEIKVVCNKTKALKFRKSDGTEVYLNEKFAKLCDKWAVDRGGVFFGTCKGILTVVAMPVNVK